MKIFIYFIQLILFDKVKTELNQTRHVEDENNIDAIAEILIKILHTEDAAKEKRFQELREKLNEIKTYVIDKEQFSELLLNETMDPELNETNFLNALEEKSDYYSFLTEKDHKSLILKLKERLNRDDIQNIILKRSKQQKALDTRRLLPALSEKMIEHNPNLNHAIDEILAEAPRDDHEFRETESEFWDPKAELEEELNTRRMYQGERSNIRDYPFMASVHVVGKFWCGGIIYSPDLVITSASCLQLMHNNRFFRENPNVLSVRIGSNHSRLGGEMINALEVYFNPGYIPMTLRNNLAVVRLRVSIRFTRTKHRIPKLLDISHSKNPPPPTTRVLILGWGVTRNAQKMSYEPVFLQKKVLPVYPNTFCKEIYGDKFVTETMFCAGTMTTGEGACDHDAGGPAIMNGRLVGVISYGPASCGFPEAPTVFTLVGAFADWIETVNETMPKYYRYTNKMKVASRNLEDLFTREPTSSPKPYNIYNYLTYVPDDAKYGKAIYTLFPVFKDDGFNYTATTPSNVKKTIKPIKPLIRK